MSEEKGTIGGGWDSTVSVSEVQTPQGMGGGSGDKAFIDQSESVTAIIGSSYLQNFLTGGGVGKGIGILTQKRFYYKGRNFAGSGKHANQTTEEGVVSIEDISFTAFSHTRYIGRLIMGILFALLGIIFSSADLEDLAFLGPLFFLAALAFVVMYFVSRNTLFMVSFPGGSFAFDIRYYPIADIRDFQRQLHLLKDHIKEGKTV